MSVKSFDRYEANETSPRIRRTIHGPTVIFGSIPLGESIDTKIALTELKDLSKCSDLKNIDIEFFNYNYVFVGFQRMVVLADCVKGKSVSTPSPSENRKEESTVTPSTAKPQETTTPKITESKPEEKKMNPEEPEEETELEEES
ncbi:MAG: hypothetical protein H7A24_14335 [Leptospiraceae bacterium]|nr:hypothetical protein [Leptospiraceae bacterium]MCP5513060.1 hypothetical protein [Leptospiraceae bacterium]